MYANNKWLAIYVNVQPNLNELIWDLCKIGKCSDDVKDVVYQIAERRSTMLTSSVLPFLDCIRYKRISLYYE